jgi:hypothetical protein
MQSADATNGWLMLLQMTREHIKDEESNCLPHLSQALQPAELQRLARQFAAARGVAPTR